MSDTFSRGKKLCLTVPRCVCVFECLSINKTARTESVGLGWVLEVFFFFFPCFCEKQISIRKHI